MLGVLLAIAAVVGTLAALCTVVLTSKSIGKLDETIDGIDRQLARADEQLRESALSREADAKRARIAAIQEVASAVTAIVEIARAGNRESVLPAARIRVRAAVSAARALGGPGLHDCYALGAAENIAYPHGYLEKASPAMAQIDSALNREIDD
jgi:hypothetical protein